jgi:hypothetical protein
MTITYEAIEFETDSEAIQHTDASGRGVAISVRGQAMAVDQNDAHRLEAAGVEFAYLCDHEMPDGSNRIVTVPVN